MNLSNSPATDNRKPTTLLCVSDTHGNLAAMEGIAQETGADAIVHAGDFGFYDQESVARLTDRELGLRIRHSHLEADIRKKALSLSRPELEDLVTSHGLLGDFPKVIGGKMTFSRPVHAVWGNHEDKDVVERLWQGRLQINNLHPVHESASRRVGRFNLFGLGGNLLVGRKLEQKPLGGGGGRVWSVLTQYARLVEHAASLPKEPGEVRVLVTHVSPGKEPFIRHLASLIRADLAVSGHMDPPVASSWTEFGVMSHREASDGLRRTLDAMGPHIDATRSRIKKDVALDAALATLTEIGDEYIEERRWRRSAGVRPFFNLPDSPKGWLLLRDREEGLEVEQITRMATL